MSQRVKKPGRSADDSQGKRRRRRPSAGSDADEDGTRSGSNSGGNGSLTGMWTPRHLNDLKVSSIYNRNSAEAPAELYRKDLISAMKLPDSEPLTPEEYWLITDSWKQEWEKGVQVPVNPESLPEPEVKLIQPVAERSHDFRLPKKKYVRVTHDDFFNPDYHQLVSTAARAEKVCSYDLDDVDAAWLGCSNADRAMQNTTLISEFLMEQVIEELELQCWEQVQTILKSQEGLGIEYDENVICDVCRSPESEEGNEMVFCDSCNICVHQACYGITTIPSGSWLCRTCTLGIKPTCVLCPNIGGAMKATRSGHTWAHVACAIWIPEVSIGSVEKMEPITKISSIPQSRWSLVCVLCKEKTGACIQCSVKTCKTAYHVTCAFKNGLEMKPIIVDENAEDGIKLRSYCQKHSVNTKKDKSQSGSEDDAEKKKMKAMTAEERNQARAEKLQQIEAEFYKYVRLKDVSQNLAVDMDIVILIYNYWKLKRKSLNNRPLVPPRPETTQLLTQQQEQDLEQMKMFVQLRQDLERVRNLCYMVSRREKLSRSFFRLREQTFQKQLALLTEKNDLTPEEREAILGANHGPSIYDQLYSHLPGGSTSNSTSTSTALVKKSALPDYEALISLIAGVDVKKDLVNGVIKSSTLASGKKVGKGKALESSSGSVASTSASAAAAAAAAAVTDAVNSALSNSGNIPSANSVSTAVTISAVNSDKSGGANPYKKQFVNGARRRNPLGGRESGASSHSESESERTAPASASDNISPTAKLANKNQTGAKVSPAAAPTIAAAVGGKSKSANRKPLSYLFDSDSSENSSVLPVGKKGVKALANKVSKGKVKGKGVAAAAVAAAAAKSNKSVKTTSYLSDSDELELPVTRTTSNKQSGQAGKDNAPIYSDSEESTPEEKPVVGTPASKKDKAKSISPPAKEKAKKSKGSSQQNLAESKIKEENEQAPAATETKGKKPAAKEKATTPKGKVKPTGGKKGRNKAGFDPTELIVPQREAAKKATESIRSVKQKTKEQPSSTEGGQEGGGSNTVTPAVSKEILTKESKSGAKKPVSSTLSDSDNDNEEEKIPVKVTRKGKSPDRKAAGKGASSKTTAAALPNAGAAIEDEMGDMKDEFDFDVGKDGSAKNVPSYVPQRQAAKKAAEHIRSGLSNIVAARLIIEDEMELARKKQKLEKGQAAGTGGKGKDDGDEGASALNSNKIESAVQEAAKKVTGKERASGKVPVKGTKGGKKDNANIPSAEQQQSTSSGKGGATAAAVSAATKEARGVPDTPDLPFLDKGSQSACRRSRERSSSSTSSSGSRGSSSSGSSCSSRSSSASSSRSSSAESASPEPRSPVVTKKASEPSAASQISPVLTKLSASATQDTGPGRKLKTSERFPNNRARLRAETPPREKPPTKSGRPAKSGPRGGDPFRSAFSPSPEPEPRPRSPVHQPKKQPPKQQQSSPKCPAAPVDHDKVSPTTKANEKSQQQRKQQQQPSRKSKSQSPALAEGKSVTSQSPEKKGGRRKGESGSSAKIPHQTEKDSDSESTPAPKTKGSSDEKRSETKTPLAPSRKSPLKHTGPNLSSESESETSADPVPAPKPKTLQLTPTRSFESTSASSPSQRKRKSQPEPGTLGLSDSDSGTEEKENAAVPSDHHPPQRGDIDHSQHQPVPTAVPSKGSKTPQKNSTGTGAAPPLSILSPLTPTENKDKEHPVLRITDAEPPEAKRPRFDGSVPTASSTSTASLGQMKSIFSPPGSTGCGRDGEILDFDSELYDLARSVVTDEYHGEDGPNSGSLSFSFSQELFSREDNKEDSARATLNLVEKLRLQHARKSGVHRPSTENSLDATCDSLLDDIQKSDSRPGSSLHEDRKDSISEISEPAPISEVISEGGKNAHSHATPFEPVPSIKSPQNLLHSAASPDRTKQSIQGDERWVPPSATGSQTPDHQKNPPPSSQMFIPNATSPRVTYANISEQSSPVPPAQQSHMSRIDGATEQDKHLNIRSPNSASSSYQQSAHARPHSNRSSSSGEQTDKTNNNLSVDTHSSHSSVVGSPMVSPILPPLGRQSQSQAGIAPPTFASMAAAMAAAAAAETSPGAGLPFGANPFMYPSLANNPAFASVFAAAAAAAAAGGASNPLAPFLSVPLPKTSPVGLGPESPLNLGGPSFPPFIPPTAAAAAAAAAVMQQAQQQQSGGTVHTPTPSPGAQQQPQSAQQKSQQRRPSDSVGSMHESKLPLNSPLSSVANSMPPPLAKPPLTSPSVLLAANNVKTVTLPPLQSAVAHIIESVVNNHSSNTNNNNTSLPKTTLPLDLQLPTSTPLVVAPTSTNPQVKSPATSPVVHQQKHQHPPPPQAVHSSLNDTMATDVGAVLANKTTENIITPAMSKVGRQQSGESTVSSAPPPGVPDTVSSPKQTPASGGRGRRASTPRAIAALKTSEKTLTGVNAVIEDMMMMSPQPKQRGRKPNSQSPARGKAPSTPGRRGGSGGRGKGKGKNVVGVRKDLAGTVYDIDFDEFEENSKEKIDLRALRERRKSSDIHAHLHEIKEKEKSSKKSKSSTSHDRGHLQNSSLGPIVLTLPVPHGDKHHSRHRSYVDKEEVPVKERKSKTKEKDKDVDRYHHQHHDTKGDSHKPHQPPLVTTISVSKGEVLSSTNKIPTSTCASSVPTSSSSSSVNPPMEKDPIHTILQAPLPGPVDMRTYSAPTGTTSDSSSGKIEFPTSLTVKDPTSEIASLFMSSSTESGIPPGNEIEDVEKALEDLVSAPKTQSGSGSVSVASAPSTQAMAHEAAKLVSDLPTQMPSASANAVNDVISSVNVSSNSSQAKTQNNTQPSGPLPTPTPPSASATVNNLLTGTGFTNSSYGHQLPLSKESVDLMGASNHQMSSMHTPVPPTAVQSEGDLSRNQLKVKIKGPFLDANYSSTNSMPPGSLPTHPHFHSSHHSLTQQNPVGVSGLPIAHAGYPPPPSYGAQDSGAYQHHQHHQHQQWSMMSSMMGGNTSNLRRMRKKELLRQYWTQDMNMDQPNQPGFPPGPPANQMPDFSGVHGMNQGQHPHHPLGRSVITIPKAVASMSIIPTKEDYRLDNPSGNESNDSNGPGGALGELWDAKRDQSSSKGSGGKPEGTQKKRRSRGIYREMAALGILPPGETPRERRRDKNSAASTSAGSGGDTNDSNSRKRMRGSNKPSRSTFIPPTLAESVDSPGGTKSDKSSVSSATSSNVPSNGKSSTTSSSSAVSAVVNVVNHPTPKLKIKFGELSNSSGGGGSSGSAAGTSSSSTLLNNTNHLSDSDKETPNKKAKGRPPKKRGLPEQSSSSSLASSASTSGFSMEELKRESMKYREKIMKDYAMAEQQEILKLSGTRRGKKKKRKAGASAAGSETDDASSVRSKSPEVKVIDGPKPKLILRFGKARSSAASDNNSTSGDKMSENGLENSSQGPEGPVEHDSGFTGSSEGSTGSAPENFKSNPKGGGKEKLPNNNNNNINTNKNNNSNGGGGDGRNGSGSSTTGDNADKVLVLELDSKASEKLQNNLSNSTNSPAPSSAKGKNNLQESSSSSSSSGEKYVPIRLKLSRCYEGYSLKNKDGVPVPLDVERENGAPSNATNQSDSCQVR